MEAIRLPWQSWELGEQIGRGGSGTVYRIKNQFTGEESALKVISIPREKSEINALRLDGYDDQSVADLYKDQLDKIIEEYKIMAQIKVHPNIVRCEDCTYVPHEDAIGWDIFIRMECLESLPHFLRNKNLAPEEITRLGIDICSALELCHSMDIVHRDIKPENVFYSEYSGYKLGDFGIARTMDHTMNVTMTGSYRFMAPEVYKNQECDKTIDIYSLGLMLYWLLNNRRLPFLPMDHPPKASENDEALQKRMSGKRMRKPLNGSGDLKDVVMKACAYNRKNRYKSAAEMKHALELTLNNQTTGEGTGNGTEAGDEAPDNTNNDGTIGATGRSGSQPANTDTEGTTGVTGGSSSQPEGTDPGVTMGNSWNDGGDTSGVNPRGSRTGKADFDPGVTVGEVKPGKRKPGNTRKPRTSRKPPQTIEGDPVGIHENLPPQTREDLKDYVLHYEKKTFTHNSDTVLGNSGNPYKIDITLKKASESRIDEVAGRKVTVPAWPELFALYSITESDGTKVYFTIVYSIPWWGMLFIMFHFFASWVYFALAMSEKNGLWLLAMIGPWVLWWLSGNHITKNYQKEREKHVKTL